MSCPSWMSRIGYFPRAGEADDWLTYTVPTVTMPELAPPGGSIIELYLPVEAGMPLSAWDENARQRTAERAIAKLEAPLPAADRGDAPQQPRAISRSRCTCTRGLCTAYLRLRDRWRCSRTRRDSPGYSWQGRPLTPGLGWLRQPCRASSRQMRF